MRSALVGGSPIVAGTVDDGDLVLDAANGLIHNHAYTVLGVEVPAADQTTFCHVTQSLGEGYALECLRHGWQWPVVARRTHQGAVGGGNDDGIIRVSWSDFSTFFDHVVISDLSGRTSVRRRPAVQPHFVESNVGPFTIREEKRFLRYPRSIPMATHYFIRSSSAAPAFKCNPATTHGLGSGIRRLSVTIVAETDPFPAPPFPRRNFRVPSHRFAHCDARHHHRSHGDNRSTRSDPFDDVDFVDFWRDLDGDGQLDKSVDQRLAQWDSK